MALRPPADAFADAVLAGARSAAIRDAAGRLAFAATPLGEIQAELLAELGRAFSAHDMAVIAGRSGGDFAVFLDRVLMAWLRAEPTLAEFLLPDPRGSGAFLFEVLRAELHDLGIDLLIEPRPEGYRLATVVRRRRVVLPLLAGGWLGATLGFVLELVHVPNGALIGFGGGLALGIGLAVRVLLGGTSYSCSECGAPAASAAERCGRCGTRFLGERAEGEGEGDEEASAGAPEVEDSKR
jgi:hypothetical protein